MKSCLLVLCFLFPLVSRAETMNNYSDAIADYYRNYRFTVTGQPIGYGPTNSLTYGLNFGFYLGGGVLQLEYTKGWGFDPVKFTSDFYSNTDANGNSSSSSSKRWLQAFNVYSYGVHYKKFLTKSFYVKGGVVYRYALVTDSYIEPGLEQTIVVEGTSWAGVIAVGNHWNIRAFTIGVDWAGWVQPFSTNIIGETYVGAVTNYGRSRTDEGKSRYITSGSIQLLRLYIGASF